METVDAQVTAVYGAAVIGFVAMVFIIWLMTK